MSMPLGSTRMRWAVLAPAPRCMSRPAALTDVVSVPQRSVRR
ncbi:MAG: hypothetical protein R3F59_38440 [Myxococcota bacterium]